MTTSTGHLPADVLAGYAAGALDEVPAWSVEAHLSACPDCRTSVATFVDDERLARNRAVVLVSVALPGAGRFGGPLERLRVPDHLLRLVAATPSLRRSWLLSVVGVLAVVVGEALVLRHTGNLPPGAVPGRAELLPYLLAGPLLVLAGVGAAFLPAFDPAHQLAAAAPTSGFTLLLTRAASALVAGLVPVVASGFFVPGPGWLPAALLLPSVALCGLALAAATVVGPVPAAVGAGALWVVPLLVLGVRRPPLVIVQWHAQALCAAVLLAAVAVLWLRRDRFEGEWPTWA